MKQLNELLKGKAIHCQTEEEAKDFLSLLYKTDCRWLADNEGKDKNHWSKYRNETGYYLDMYNIISFASIGWYKQHGYEIITYQQFKELIDGKNTNENKEKTYTLDELKSEVDKFRDYLLKVCEKNECIINVEFEGESYSGDARMIKKVETRINIF